MNKRQKKKKEKLIKGRQAVIVLNKDTKAGKDEAKLPAVKKKETQNEKAEDCVCIDFAGFSTRNAFHEAMHAEALFPDYTGNNLDALFDMLTEINKPLTIRLVNLNEWEVAAESYRGNIKKLFERAGRENECLKVEA